MKLSRLIDPQFQETLRKLAATDIPLKTAFKLRGIIKRGNDELQKYDEVRSAALNRLGDKNEDGTLAADEKGTVKLSGENLQEFTEQLTILINQDINIGTVSIGELGDKLSLTTNELLNLDDLIVE